MRLNDFIAKLRVFLVLCMLFLTYNALAQYTNVINSNRPGLSESPYSVGTGVYQLETSIFYRETNKHPTFYRPQSYGVDFLLRSSFLNEKLEFNVNLAYQNQEIGFQNIFNSSYRKTGISKLVIAAKYLVYEKKYEDKSKEIRSWVARNSFDWKRLVPSVAIYAGANTGIPENIYKANNFSPKVGILLQNDLSDNFNIITNMFYDRIGTDLPELSYIITATYNYRPRWSIFIENQTMFDKYQYQSNIGTGIAFLFNRNLQVNSSIRLLADGRSSGFYSSFGASYRLDKHIDKAVDIGKEVMSKNRRFFGKKGFFNNLGNKFKNLFRKKEKRISTKKSNLKKETIQSINSNSFTNEENKSNSTNSSLRVKPLRKRISPTKIKIKKENSKKREKNTKQDSEKNTKELEKEIKNLEKEVKKDNKKIEKEKKKEENRKKKTERKKRKEKDEDEDGVNNY